MILKSLNLKPENSAEISQFIELRNIEDHFVHKALRYYNKITFEMRERIQLNGHFLFIT